MLNIILLSILGYFVSALLFIMLHRWLYEWNDEPYTSANPYVDWDVVFRVVAYIPVLCTLLLIPTIQSFITNYQISKQSDGFIDEINNHKTDFPFSSEEGELVD